MEITHETSAYNERRYGKPWIAKVGFTNPKGDFVFGDWVGDSRNGGAGMLLIDAKPGEIIAIGQKDNRQPRNSSPDFYSVTLDGNLAPIGDKGNTYKWWKSRPVSDNREKLIAERDRLLARITEINELLKGE